MNSEKSTEALSASSSTALFSPLPVQRESVVKGSYYLWAANDDLKVVRLNEREDGLQEMITDVFNERDEWYFRRDLIGELYGPINLSENAELTRPEVESNPTDTNQ